MLRQPFFLAVLSASVLVPSSLLAGGPPWLCLPIDGVTQDNAAACAKLLAEKLHSKLNPHVREPRGIEMRKVAEQWYLALAMGDDVRLSDFEAALQGTGFSVPHRRLRLFGHVILEIEAPKPGQKLLTDLEALDRVSVAGSESAKDALLVTIDMPYPLGSRRGEEDAPALDRFERNDFASDPATRSESPAAAGDLPSYSALGDVVAKHGASLKDIRFSTSYACRTLGGVAIPDAERKVSKSDR
jgi:hypothetical protein